MPFSVGDVEYMRVVHATAIRALTGFRCIADTAQAYTRAYLRRCIVMESSPCEALMGDAGL
jgi:hypothetical protein